MAATISGVYRMLEGSENEISSVAYNREPTWSTQIATNNAFRYTDNNGGVHNIYEYESLSGLIDVNVSSITNGNLLIFNGSGYSPVDPGTIGNLIPNNSGYTILNDDTTYKITGSGGVDFSVSTLSLTGAEGARSFATGYNTHASGDYSYAGGQKTVALGDNSTAIGKFNEPNSGNIFEVGVGVDVSNRANGFEISDAGALSAPKQTSLITEDSHLTTKAYVESVLPKISKGVAILFPVETDLIPIYYTSTAIDITSVRGIVTGGTSNAFSLNYDSVVSATTGTVIASGTVLTNTSGYIIPITTTSVPANNWIYYVGSTNVDATQCAILFEASNA
ncbi:MAG: hypothetical protein GY787_21445 [Alteromonadales bacterium]|nr:hypothetical protein [Alteromonadales bacterium]